MGARILAVLLQTKRAEVPGRVLLRNTAAVIVPLAIGIATDRLGIGLAIAVGAIVTMYSDQPGPYRQRLARLLTVSVAGAVAAFIGMVLGASLPALLAAAAIVGFAGALLVVFGDAAGRVGMAAMILLAITAAHPVSAWTALQSAALIACGGLLLTLFSIAAWPLQRHGPEREALSAVYRGLAVLARQRNVDTAAAPALTDAMTSLQHTLLGPHRARGAVMDSFGVLLELAERIRLELTALADGDSTYTIGQIARDQVASLLDRIADSVMTGSDADQLMTRSVRELRAAEAGFRLGSIVPSEAVLDAPPDARELARLRHLHALCGQLAAAARNAGRASIGGALRSAEEDLQLPRAVRPQSSVSILIASITPRSAAFRHAVRTAVCLVIATWIGRLLALFSLSHGYWIPMTVAIVLRADYGATFSYGLLRVAGTATGLLLTTGLLHFLPPEPWVRLAVMAVLCVGFRYFGTVHYGVAVTALTGMVVLLLALAGEPAAPTMVSRLIATVVGSAMALAAYGLWPTRERGRIHTSLGRLLRAYAAYLTSLGHPSGTHERREARNAVRVARANAEAAIGRLLAEPGTTASVAELAQSVLSNSNRLARTTMALDAVLGEPGAVPQARSIEALLSQGASALEQIAEAAEKRERPEVPVRPRSQYAAARLRASQRDLARALGGSAYEGIGGELTVLSDRLVDNINTLAHIVARPGEPVPCSTAVPSR